MTAVVTPQMEIHRGRSIFKAGSENARSQTKMYMITAEKWLFYRYNLEVYW